MTDREVCASCRGPWPCACSPQAALVVMMEDADDVAARIARGMARQNDPLIEKPYDPPLRTVHHDEFCGHFQQLFDLDIDRRVVSCRKCGTALDPYDVLASLARIDHRVDERLRDLRELEKVARQREAERQARAAARRHPYDPISSIDRVTRQRLPECCRICAGLRGGDIHNAKPRDGRRRRS